MLRHTPHSHGCETICSPSEWVINPVMDVMGNQSILDGSPLDAQNTFKRAKRLREDCALLFPAQPFCAWPSSPSSQNWPAWVGPPGWQPVIVRVEEPKIVHRPKPSVKLKI